MLLVEEDVVCGEVLFELLHPAKAIIPAKRPVSITKNVRFELTGYPLSLSIIYMCFVRQATSSVIRALCGQEKLPAKTRAGHII